MISDSLQEILDGFKSCGVDCRDVYRRADVLTALREHGADIDHGNYRSAWIERPEFDRQFLCVVFTQKGAVTCYQSSKSYQKSLSDTMVLSADEFLRMIEEPEEQVFAPDMQSLDSFLFV